MGGEGGEGGETCSYNTNGGRFAPRDPSFFITMKPGSLFRGMKRRPAQRLTSVTAVAAKHGRAVSAEAYARRRNTFAAAERGTKLHSDVYNWLNNCDPPKDQSEEFRAFARWREARKGWHFVDGERLVVRGKIKGRYDAVFRTEVGQYVLVDWKYGELGDSSRAKAELQLNLYRHLVKRGRDPPSILMIVNFKNGMFREIMVEVMPDEDVLRHF